MILIIDDDYSITASLGLLLKQAGHRAVTAATPSEAVRQLERHAISLVLQDMNFSRATTGEEGLVLLKRIKALYPELPVLLITAWGSIELAVAGMKAGAADFITKPWNNDQILLAVDTALELAATRAAHPSEAQLTRASLDERFELEGVIGEDRRFLEMLELACRVSATDASVLITGDSGTGKEVVAAAIHRNSPRRAGPFVRVNLGGIPTALFESEMFGHVRGAFTDAMRDREGRFAKADGGTILLDEIGDLDLRCQVKLLRVLQDRTFEVLGSSQTRRLDVRVISATNSDLRAAVAAGEFREDLFYRLNLISIHLPRMAERPGDIPLLAQHFLKAAAAKYEVPCAALSDGAISWLQNREWPGNIRQLMHLLERAVLVSATEILEARDLERVAASDLREGGQEVLPSVGSMTMSEVEKAMIVKTLAHYGGNLSRVAASLGMSRAALYRRLEKYEIKP
jgi:DNA-binding NtrC family response regulator